MKESVHYERNSDDEEGKEMVYSNNVPELLPTSPKRAWSPSYSPTSPEPPDPEEQDITLVEQISYLTKNLKEVKNERDHLRSKLIEAEKKAERAEKKIEENKKIIKSLKPSVSFSWVKKSVSTQTPKLLPFLLDKQLINSESPAKRMKTKNGTTNKCKAVAPKKDSKT